MTMEIWQEIEGYEGYYSVSSMGRMKSLSRPEPAKLGVVRTRKETIMRCAVGKRGYLVVSLRRPGEKQVKRPVHRLVAIAFVRNEFGLNEINHIDGDKLNNRCDNLEWCTHAHNMAHGWDNGLMPYPRKHVSQKGGCRT